MGFEILREYVDDGISGAIPIDERPAGAELVKAIAANGVAAVLVWNGERIGREQPIFWQFIGLCRAKHMEVFDHDGHRLTDPMEGAIYGMTAEMDYRKIKERLAAGKARARALGRKVAGQYQYGEHPNVAFAHERAIVTRVTEWKAEGMSNYSIAAKLNAEGCRTRFGKKFRTTTISRILEREPQKGGTQRVKS
jgi:site-specific DNA recombinase